MRERNIWRGRRVPGETHQDFPLRIVNHPPAADGLRLAVLHDLPEFCKFDRHSKGRYVSITDVITTQWIFLASFLAFHKSAAGFWGLRAAPDRPPVI